MYGNVPADLATKGVPFEAESARPARYEERVNMVTETVRARGVENLRVLGALVRVPRHEFVPEYLQSLAYADQPLPIGDGQTISQPYIVALMTSLADLKVGERCLEIGTGSGYQTAILAEMGALIFTIEIRPDLAASAETRLRALGYPDTQIQCRTADGHYGWPEVAPFDAIMATAAPEHLPSKLLSQLALNGRFVVPIGPRNGVQQLETWVRQGMSNDESAFERSFVLDVQFVPMLSTK
jgi:protein-L-isoaspartate(D-aspartate) O-methyltransferase